MNNSLTIRQETGEDYIEVFEVNQLAFANDNEARLVDSLRNNTQVFVPELSIVASIHNKIVGHILLSKVRIKGNRENYHISLSLAPMAVKPEFQKQGIGGQLIKKGLELAKHLKFKSVLVLGHEHYYPKFGFEPAEKWNIKTPFDVPSNLFMAIELEPDGLKGVSGVVIYPKEFDEIC